MLLGIWPASLLYEEVVLVYMGKLSELTPFHPRMELVGRYRAPNIDK